METVAQIIQPHRDRIERANRHEALIGKQKQLEQTIARLEGVNFNVDALRQIHTLSGEVPPDLLTSGASTLGYTIPRGLDVRHVLMSVAGGAIDLAQRKTDERNAELTAARTTLAAVEVELAALELSA